MNVDTAKRVMALQRQIKAVRQFAKSGDLTPVEVDVLVKEKQAEIDAIRAQTSLSFKTDGGTQSGKK